MVLGGMSSANEETPLVGEFSRARRNSQIGPLIKSLCYLVGELNMKHAMVFTETKQIKIILGKIVDDCNSNCPFDPPCDEALGSNCYNYIYKIPDKWIDAYANAKCIQQSGWSDNEVLTKVNELYSGGRRGNLKLMSE